MRPTPRLKLTDEPIGLTDFEIADIRRRVLNRGAAPVARALACQPSTLLAALLGLPITRATAERIRDRVIATRRTETPRLRLVAP